MQLYLCVCLENTFDRPARKHYPFCVRENETVKPTIMNNALGKFLLGTLSFFRVEHNDCLTNATWTSMAQYNVTGAVTFVTDINTVPTRFYRAIAP